MNKFTKNIIDRSVEYINHFKLNLREMHQNGFPFVTFDNHENGRLLLSVSNTQNSYFIENQNDKRRNIYNTTQGMCKNATSEEVNYLSPIYQNTPLILAISKGYNHVGDVSSFTQKGIIDSLLERNDIDINTKGDIMGLTALEIAILRGDDLSIIKKLIEKGAQAPSDARIKDLLSLSYDNVKIIMNAMTGNHSKIDAGENKFYTFTVNTYEQFKENKKAILQEFNIIDVKYHTKLANVFKSIFDPLMELWNDKDLGIIGKALAILLSPAFIAFTVIAAPFAPFLAIGDSFGKEKSMTQNSIPKSVYRTESVDPETITQLDQRNSIRKGMSDIYSINKKKSMTSNKIRKTVSLPDKYIFSIPKSQNNDQISMI